MPKKNAREGSADAALAAISDPSDVPSVRRVLATTLTVVGVAYAVVALSVGTLLVGMWWPLGGSDWWHRDELRHALEDKYRDNPQAFDDAADVMATYVAKHPGADWMSMSASSVCVSDPPENAWECEDLTVEQGAVVAKVIVDKPYAGTSLYWDEQFGDLVFVNLYHETREGGLLVHDLGEGDLLGFVDDNGFECVEMLADGWCSMVRQ